MRPKLERRYRRLLRAYPAAYRATHEDEILGTLAESSRPGQRLPSLREALGLLIGGMRARAWAAGGGTPNGVVADGLYLGVTLYYLVHVGMILGTANQLVQAPDPWPQRLLSLGLFALLAVTLVCLLRGWLRWALMLELARSAWSLVGTIGSFDSPGWTLGWTLAFLPMILWHPTVLAGLVVAVRTGRTRWRPRPRSLWWLAPLGIAGVAMLSSQLVSAWAMAHQAYWLTELHNSIGSVLTVVMFGAILLAALTDPRTPTAAAVVMAGLLLGFVPNGPTDLGFVRVAALCIVLLAAALFGTRRLARP